MLQPQLSRLHGARLAGELSKTADTRQAVDLLARGLQQLLGASVVILNRHGAEWSPIAGSDPGTYAGSLTTELLSFGNGEHVVKFGAADGSVTAVQLSPESDSDPELAFLVHGDLTASAE